MAHKTACTWGSIAVAQRATPACPAEAQGMLLKQFALDWLFFKR